MKWRSILFAFVLLPCFSFSQKASKIYDSRGRLIADTLFSIDKKQLRFFIGKEDTLIKKLVSYQVIYPEQMRDANISDDFVLSFQLSDSGTFYNIEIGNLIVHNNSKNYFLPIVITNLKKIHQLANFVPKSVSNKKFYLDFKFHMEECKTDTTYFSQGTFIVKGKRIPLNVVY
jgi:hypothetical protein